MALIKASVAVDERILKKVQENQVDTSRFLRRDFDELVILKRDCHPRLLAANLKQIRKRYDDETRAADLDMLIDELELAAQLPDLQCGDSTITNIHALQSTGEVMGTFIVHRYKRSPSGQTVVDAIVISASQRLSIDWAAFGLEAAFLLGVGFLINPALGVEELIGMLAAGVHIAVNYAEVKQSRTEENAKALLIKTLVDKRLACIENNKLRRLKVLKLSSRT